MPSTPQTQPEELLLEARQTHLHKRPTNAPPQLELGSRHTKKTTTMTTMMTTTMTNGGIVHRPNLPSLANAILRVHSTSNASIACDSTRGTFFFFLLFCGDSDISDIVRPRSAILLSPDLDDRGLGPQYSSTMLEPHPVAEGDGWKEEKRNLS